MELAGIYVLVLSVRLERLRIPALFNWRCGTVNISVTLKGDTSPRISLLFLYDSSGKATKSYSHVYKVLQIKEARRVQSVHTNRLYRPLHCKCPCSSSLQGTYCTTIILPPFQNISLGRDFHYGSHTDVSRYILECRFTHFAPYVVHGGIYTKTCI